MDSCADSADPPRSIQSGCDGRQPADKCPKQPRPPTPNPKRCINRFRRFTPTPNKVMSQNYRCEICEMTAKCLRNAAKWCEVDGVKAAKPREMAAKPCETPAKWLRNSREMAAKWCEMVRNNCELAKRLRNAVNLRNAAKRCETLRSAAERCCALLKAAKRC